METNSEKLPQNIANLIGEIGESLVLFHLFEKTRHNRNLEVYKNYSDAGYDIGIRKINSNSKLKIEVKTRQRLISKSGRDACRSSHFTLTQNERNSADFLVAYWLEFNDFFIVPTNELDESKSKSKLQYKHVVNRAKNPKEESKYTTNSGKYLDKWDLILSKLDEM